MENLVLPQLGAGRCVIIIVYYTKYKQLYIEFGLPIEARVIDDSIFKKKKQTIPPAFHILFFIFLL